MPTELLPTVFQRLLEPRHRCLAIAARSFLRAYGGWPGSAKKTFENIKQESDLVLESVKMTNAVEEGDKGIDYEGQLMDPIVSFTTNGRNSGSASLSGRSYRDAML